MSQAHGPGDAHGEGIVKVKAGVIGASDLEEAFALHQLSAGDFIVALDRERFSHMVRGEMWVGVRAADQLVAIAYVEDDDKVESERPRLELGGVFVVPHARGHQLGRLVSSIALMSALLRVGARTVVSYVHQDNGEAVREMLRLLGFSKTTESLTVPADRLRGSLRRDDRGIAVAQVFELREPDLLTVVRNAPSIDPTAQPGDDRGTLG